MILKKAKNATKRALSFTGFCIMREKSLHPLVAMQDDLKDPIGLQYISTRNGVVVSAPKELGRALPLFGYNESSAHPFLIAAREASRTNFERNVIIKKILAKYYEMVRPESINSILGISSENKELSNLPGWAVLMPWDKENIFQWKEKIESSVMLENSCYRKNVGVKCGWAWAGPTSEIKCEIESRRLLGVLDSVLKYGYKRHNGPDGDIVANVLVRSPDEWVWQSIGAQHRASVLSALGEETIPVRVMRVIRREDVLSWPNVVRGLYTKEEAIKIFDDIFHANYSHVALAWEEYVSANGYA